ncbi:MAG TPA: hypothetical protein VE890_08350, partial [Thermoguttaceae bacterium]|nr:hypothetical protein [Thermoguttaceae bacterium]
MRARMKTVLQSLGFRLLVPLLTTVGVVLAVYAMISFSSTKDHFLQFVRADIGRSSELIKRATHDGMLLNRKEEVQATVQRLAEGPAIAAIRVYDKAGVIMISADDKEIGQEIEPDSDTCLSCHEKDRTRDVAVLEREGLSRIGDGSEVLRHLSVIENEPSCAAVGCHLQPSEQRVLGILDLEMSMAPLDATI